MKVLHDFYYFLNPNNSERLISNYDYISFNCLKYCSYVLYLVIPTCNGEIFGNAFICSFQELDSLCIECTIYCINSLDYVCLEVYFK